MHSDTSKVPDMKAFDTHPMIEYIDRVVKANERK